jgi:Phage tail assembly chaperone protein
MQIRIRTTGAVIFDSEFRTYAQTQGAVFGSPLTEEFINQYGGDVVLEGPQASGGTVYQYSQSAGVEQLDGKWYTKYVLGPVFTDGETTAAEQETAYKAMKDAEQAKSVRDDRTKRLSDSDWTQIADSTADKLTWATYRQALRDIPAQAGFPWTIDWPEVP